MLVMKIALKYGFTTCTFAYLLVVIALLVLFATVFRGSHETIVDIKSMLSFLTLMLSEFSWWGDYYYLAFLVPWLTSCFVLTLFLYRFDGGTRTRALFTGFSMFIYYFVTWLSFLIYGLLSEWGDIGYDIIWLWPVCSFGFGYLVSIIVERAFKSLILD